MKVRWADQAAARLAEIEDYVAADSPQAAMELVERLIDRAEQLAGFPQSGRRLPELPASDLRELIEGNYRIVYRIRDDWVEVLTVIEGHQQLRVDEVVESD